MGRLSETGAGKFTNREDLLVSKKDGDVGHWTGQGIGSIVSNQIEFTEYGEELLMLTGNEHFEIVRSGPSPLPGGGTLYYVRQYINNIPIITGVGNAGINFFVENETNAIVRINGGINTLDDRAIIEPKVSARGAQKIVRKFMAENLNRFRINTKNQRLVYRKNQGELELVWELTVTDADGPRKVVYVNGDSGKVEVGGFFLRATNACKQSSTTVANLCNVPW